MGRLAALRSSPIPGDTFTGKSFRTEKLLDFFTRNVELDFHLELRYYKSINVNNFEECAQKSRTNVGKLILLFLSRPQTKISSHLSLCNLPCLNFYCQHLPFHAIKRNRLVSRFFIQASHLLCIRPRHTNQTVR